jgi:hypothetical protein
MEYMNGSTVLSEEGSSSGDLSMRVYSDTGRTKENAGISNTCDTGTKADGTILVFAV